MNGIAASMLLNMTSSMRFEGSLNVDLNDITMNLVPYPQVSISIHVFFSTCGPVFTWKELLAILTIKLCMCMA